MARFTTTIHTPRSVQEAFRYMADLRNFAEWDPGVEKVTQVVGDGGGVGTEFDVEVDAPVGTMTMRYKTVDHVEPNRVVARSETGLLTSVDTITVTPDSSGPGGSEVTYDAELTLKYGLGIADPLLQRVFDKIGNRAARGLQKALDGERVS